MNASQFYVELATSQISKKHPVGGVQSDGDGSKNERYLQVSGASGCELVFATEKVTKGNAQEDNRDRDEQYCVGG